MRLGKQYTNMIACPAYLPSKAVLRARCAITMAGEKAARGTVLFSPLAKLDNPQILVENGIITEISTNSRAHFGFTPIDLGDVCVVPRFVNAHTHLQLSWLKNKLRFHSGFTAWLKSLVPHILNVVNAPAESWENLVGSLRDAFASLMENGTGYVVDIGGSIPGALTTTGELACQNNLDIACFCEWFGFNPSLQLPWPLRCKPELEGNSSLRQIAIPCGHALYSTDLELLRKVKNWCVQSGKIFTFHLAESNDETELLTNGSGPLFDYYMGKVLPETWRPPGERPFHLAKKLGLLDARTLVAHGVTLNNKEIAQFAQSNAALCLCPRSNEMLKVGTAPLDKYLQYGARLCLGTDGLSSNIDLDVRNEALFLREKWDLPLQCLLRLLTVNGMDALGAPPEKAQLIPGAKASFGILAADFAPYM